MNIKDAANKVTYTEQITRANKMVNKNKHVRYLEERYPEMTNEFKNIQREQYALFCEKQHDYGPSNIAVGASLDTEDDIKLSLTGLWFRLNDKIQRLKQLVVLRHPDEVDESIEDTFQDLSIYGMIAQIVQNGKWGK